MATWQLESRDYLWSDASLEIGNNRVDLQVFICRLFLGCLQATPSISEVALVDPDMAAAPSLDLWQMGLTTTGVRMVHI